MLTQNWNEAQTPRARRFWWRAQTPAQVDCDIWSPLSAEPAYPQEGGQVPQLNARSGLCELDLQNFRVYDIACLIEAAVYVMGLIVTACTKRKAGNPAVRMSALAPGSIDEVGGRWVAALNAAETMTTAAELYQGGSHAESRRAVAESNYHHLIVSAGLGLVAADSRIPNYAASVLPGEDGVLAKLSGCEDAGNWWSWIQDRSPFARSLEAAMKATGGLCLIALPHAYLWMVAADILSLPSALLMRVRLFSGSKAPSRLAHLQMPYDDRLDGADSPLRGTRANFAARAMRHFAISILPTHNTQSAPQHAAAVIAALSTWRSPTPTRGERKTDAELREILRTNWEAVGGRSTLMLRLLRDDLGVACEQRRFANLFRDLRTEREGAS